MRSPRILSAPDRIGVAPEVIRRTLDGKLKVAPDGRSAAAIATSAHRPRKAAARPDPVQAAWLYAQMVRWGQAPMSGRIARGGRSQVFRPDLYDECLGAERAIARFRAVDGIGAFAGPAFDPHDIAAHLAVWKQSR